MRALDPSRRFAARLPRSLRRFARSRRGVAAVEFALVLPFMLVLYFGVVEVSQGVSADRKLTLLSRSLADLTGRVPSVTTAELDSIFAASTAVMHPYDTEGLGMSIASIVVKPVGSEGAVRGEVCWSEQRNGGGGLPRTAGSTVDVPEGFRTPNTTYILAEVRKPYKPTIGYVVTGTLNLTEATPWPVRNVSEVTRSGVQPCLRQS